MGSSERVREVAESLFESKEDVDALRRYIKEVVGDDVNLANLSPKQQITAIKIMGIDKLHLDPSDDVPDSKNVCKNMMSIMVETSKSTGVGLESIQSILEAKVKLEDDSGYFSGNEPEPDGDDSND